MYPPLLPPISSFLRGLCTESDYPYVSGETTHQHLLCLQKNCKVVADSAPRNYTDVQVNSEAALMSAISMQPVRIRRRSSYANLMLSEVKVKLSCR